MKRPFTRGDKVTAFDITKDDVRNGFTNGDVLTVRNCIRGGENWEVDFEENTEGFLWANQLKMQTPRPTSDTKATNPKDLIGSTKLPLNLVPATLQVYAAMAFTEGATKYGAFNWRVAGVRASIYKAAHDRHMEKYWNGEDADPVTGVPHLASAIACLAIIADAKLAGKLTDDRPPKVPMSKLIDDAEATVKHLMELHKDKKPHHHTALDSQ